MARQNNDDKKKRKNCSLCADKVEAIDYKDAATASRLREYVIARQMYIALIKELYGTRYTYRQIGSMALFEHKFGYAVVWHHLKKFEDEINQPFMADIKQIYEELLQKFNTKH